MRNSLTDDIIDSRLIQQCRPIIRLGNCVQGKLPILWLCIDCNHKWETSPNLILNAKTGCPSCYHKNRAEKIALNNTNNIIEILSKKNIVLLSSYTKTSEKHQLKCIVCNYTWESTNLKSICYSTVGCAKCVGLAKITNQDLDHFLIKREVTFVRLGNIVNTKTKLEFKCLDCDLIWTTTPDSILHKYSGCPYCNDLGTFTRHFFTKNQQKKNVLGLLYLVSGYDGINTFLKIGITQRTTKIRYTRHGKTYNIKEIGIKSMALYEAFLLEQQSLKQFRKFVYRPEGKFDGKTECFQYKQEIIDYFNTL